MDWDLRHRRSDGTFVVVHNGYLYHVVQSDPIYAAVAAAAEGVELPPEPPPSTGAPLIAAASPTALEFMERFTAEERINIRRAAKENELLEDWLDLLRASQFVDVTDPRTVAGMEAMVAAGLISEQRCGEVLR